MNKTFHTKPELNDWGIFDAAIVMALVFMFTPTFYRLATMGWPVADYTHAYFILPVALGLIWLRHSELKKSRGFDKNGACLLLFGVLCYVYGAKNQFMFIEAASFVFVSWALFLLKFTWESVKKSFFPLAYLLFLIPPPGMVIDTLSMPLKKISTYGAYLVLASFHVPVVVYGTILNIGGHELFIADACNGFRSITALLALGSIYAYFQPVLRTQKVVLFFCIIPVAIIGNILRISLIGMLAYSFGTDFAKGFFHEFSGIILYIFTVLGLVCITAMMKGNDDELE